MARQWLTSGGVLVSDTVGRQWVASGGTIVCGSPVVRSIGTSAGSAAVAGIGKVKARSVGSSPGVAAVAGVGKVKARSVGSSPGTAAVAGIGKVKAIGVGASHGSAAVAGVGRLRTVSVGSASGRAASKDRTIRLWGGHGVLKIGGNDYLPLGDRAFAQQTSGAIGGVAQGMTLGVSGVEADALALIDPAEVKGASVVVYRLIFASDGKTLLDAHVWDRGRGDAIASDETIGGPASVALAVESTARGLGRSGARMRADYDQRLLDPNDGYFKNTAYAAEKSLYWGGQKPSRTGAAVNGSGSGMGGASSPPLGSFNS